MISKNHSNINNNINFKPLNYQRNNNYSSNIVKNTNQQIFLQQIKAKINYFRDQALQRFQQEFIQICDNIFKEIENSSFPDQQQQSDDQMNEIQNEEHHITMNNNFDGKDSDMNVIGLQETTRVDQRNGIENQQLDIYQSQSTSLQNEASHKPSSPTSVQEDEIMYGENIDSNLNQQQEQKQERQPKKRKRINKEIQTRIQYRESYNRVQDNPQEKKDNDNSTKKQLSFKNQIKGFISKYFKRLAKQKRQNLLDIDMPTKMFERMKGSYKKNDLFLILNQYFQQDKPTEDEYNKYINDKNYFQYQLEKLKVDPEILQDDGFLEKQSLIKIKEREFKLLTELIDYLKDSQYEGYDGFKEFIIYYNRLTSFFRKDIFKYLMSQSYVHDLCIKRAGKIDQIYIKNIILNMILNPKIFV
ncbi:hypothetical protein ABPG72_021450 [Tetrahymena utriculariae]